MSASNKILQAAAGNAAGESVYVEDVFSTVLYSGGSAQNFEVGVDMTEGGLLWFKRRDSSQHHALFDSESNSDFNKYLRSDGSNALDNLNDAAHITVDSEGFNLSSTGYNLSNNSSGDYVTWMFRKQAGFFDIQTWTGNSTAGRTISHDLGSVPGMIIIKSTSAAGEPWYVYHRETDSSAPEDYHTLLNSTAARADSVEMLNDTAPTATEFTVSQYNSVNGSGKTYIAYLFAHDDQSFGDNSDEAIIKCGSYTGNGSTTGPEINLGFEPQLLMIKASSGSTGNWYMYDSMRGLTAISSNDAELYPSSSGAEYAGRESINVTATGFQLATTNTANNANGSTYIYIAIRRPMKTPEAGTEVFAIDQPDSSSEPKYRAPFSVDMAWFRSNITSTQNTNITNRLTGKGNLILNATTAEANENAHQWDYMNGWFADQGTETNNRSWMFKRAAGFFDVVAYVADQTSTHAHNLGVTPEFAIIKQRNGTNAWKAYHTYLGNNQYLQPHTNIAAATDTGWASVNASTFFLKANNGNNIAYLWATVAGVSKVGSYSGTGSSQDIDCGFSAGARFVLIKRTDSSGDWYYWDSNRGIVAGNDPYLLWNSTAAQVTNTDYIDPLNAGFTVSTSTSALNSSSGTYIFLAIA